MKEYIISEEIKNNTFLTKICLKYIMDFQQLVNDAVEGLIHDYVYDDVIHGEYLNKQLEMLEIDSKKFYLWCDKYWMDTNFIKQIKVDYKELYFILKKKALESVKLLVKTTYY